MAEPSAPGRSFDEEALPHLDTLYRVALRFTADPTLAEDLVHLFQRYAVRHGPVAVAPGAVAAIGDRGHAQHDLLAQRGGDPRPDQRGQ